MALIISDSTKQQEAMRPLEARATLIGYLGLIPFFMVAFALWFTPLFFSYNFTGKLMAWGMYYAAIILSFLGGIRWGLALLNDKNISDYVTISQLTWSIVPALMAWLTVVPANTIPGISPTYLVQHLILLIAFISLMGADVQATRDNFAPAWYGPLRVKLTFFLGLMMMLTIIKLFMLGW